jgi:chemotaxis family two-component system response regulator Rcp1
MAPETIQILMVDDNPTDIMLTREALKQAKLLVTLHVVVDGVEAMEFLRREGRFCDAPQPHLILLDVNMARKSGLEVLVEVKADSKLKAIPVVILTSSVAEADIMKAYGSHANCYIRKPVDFEGLVAVVRSIRSFWFTIVTLPST